MPQGPAPARTGGRATLSHTAAVAGDQLHFNVELTLRFYEPRQEMSLLTIPWITGRWMRRGATGRIARRVTGCLLVIAAGACMLTLPYAGGDVGDHRGAGLTAPPRRPPGRRAPRRAENCVPYERASVRPPHRRVPSHRCNGMSADRRNRGPGSAAGETGAPPRRDRDGRADARDQQPDPSEDQRNQPQETKPSIFASSGSSARYRTSTRSPSSYAGGLEPIELRNVVGEPPAGVNSTTGCAVGPLL